MAFHFGLHALVAYSISSHTMLASSNGGISDQKAETQKAMADFHFKQKTWHISLSSKTHTFHTLMYITTIDRK